MHYYTVHNFFTQSIVAFPLEKNVGVLGDKYIYNKVVPCALIIKALHHEDRRIGEWM
jgi:hypothetical protein